MFSQNVSKRIKFSFSEIRVKSIKGLGLLEMLENIVILLLHIGGIRTKVYHNSMCLGMWT